MNIFAEAMPGILNNMLKFKLRTGTQNLHGQQQKLSGQNMSQILWFEKLIVLYFWTLLFSVLLFASEIMSSQFRSKGFYVVSDLCVLED